MGFYKICQHCGRRLLMGERCGCKAVKDKEAARQKFYDQNKRNRESKMFYNSIRWHAIRDEVMAAAYGLDEIEFSNGRGIRRASTSHLSVARATGFSAGYEESDLRKCRNPCMDPQTIHD